MDILLIFVGIFFTANPMLGLLDIFPDLIGFVMIFIGVNRLGMISPEIADTVQYFKWAAVISAARLMTFIASGGFDETMVLCLTMVFAVAEFAVMLPAVSHLFDGLSYLNIRYSGKTEEVKEFKAVGAVFFAVRGFLSVVPELGALSLGADPSENVTGEASRIEWSEFSTILGISNVVLTLIFAAFWIAMTVKYIGSMLKDKEFISALNAAYKEKKRAEPEIFIRKRLLYAFSALTLAAVFLIDFTGDGVNFIPDIGFGALSLIAVWLMSEYCGDCRKAYISGGAYTALSAASYIYSVHFAKTRYFMTFDTMMIMFPSEYAVGVILTVFEGAALIVYIRYLIPILAEISEGHIGLRVTDEYKRTIKQNEDTKKRLSFKLKIWFYAVCAAAASGVAFSATMHAFPVYWMIHMAINIFLFVFVLHIISVFVSEINMRYEKPGE